MSEISVLRAALAEASSPSWSHRVRAGCDLAAFADVPQAAEKLVGLLLDAADTAVTRQAAEALARVGTVAAVRLIALAVAEADDNQADWMRTGLDDALAGLDSAPDIAAVCGRLARDPAGAVRRGAAEILAWTQDTWC
ncbi:HEAT repeat domain-containing protein [Streptomyces sp. NPDC054834]